MITGNVHTIQIKVTVSGSNADGGAFGVDNVSIKSISGPGANEGCQAPSPSAAALPPSTPTVPANPASTNCKLTNIIPSSINPSFDTGSYDPWLSYPQVSPNIKVLSSTTAKFAPYSGSYAMYYNAVPDNVGTTSLTVLTDYFDLPTATTADCTIRVKIAQNNSPPNPGVVSVAMYINDVLQSSSVTSGEIEWTGIGGTANLLAQNNVIRVRIGAPPGYPERSWTVALDDLVCYDTAQQYQ
jgi:hypothetical protein